MNAQTAEIKTHIQIESEAFKQGFIEGQTETGNVFPCPLTEGELVCIVENLTEIAKEGWLTEELLRHDTRLIAGWLTRSFPVSQ